MTNLTIEECGKKLKTFIWDMKICQCAYPWEAIILIKEILQTYKEKSENFSKENSKEKIAEFNETINKLLPTHGIQQIVLSVLDTGSLLEHGGNLLAAWVDTQGDQFLEIFEKYSIDELKEEFNK